MNDITIKRPIKWECSAQSHVGMVRDLNEDSVLSKQDSSLWIVADGMGGYEAGNIASKMVVNAMEDVGSFDTLDEFVTQVEDNLLDVNQRMLEYSEIMLDGRSMGSTAVTLMIQGQLGACLWVGDSRLYLFRNNTLSRLSQDHSQVEEMIRQGLISDEEALNHPESNVITRAIGVASEVCVDINLFKVQLGDIFLLCSDGLYNMVNADRIIERLQQGHIETAANDLIQDALDNGARDNVSLILVKGLPSKDLFSTAQE